MRAFRRIGWVCIPAALLVACGPGQEEPEPVGALPFEGAWTLESWVLKDGAGEVAGHPYGEDARGQITYAAGRMSAGLMRTAWSEASREDRPEGSLLTYWGSYSVDPDAGTVTHHVEGALFPDWVGSDLVRSFRFEGRDRLTLSTPPQGDENGQTTFHELVWARSHPQP